MNSCFPLVFLDGFSLLFMVVCCLLGVKITQLSPQESHHSRRAAGTADVFLLGAFGRFSWFCLMVIFLGLSSLGLRLSKKTSVPSPERLPG